jgi:hypothetical protein
MQHKFQAQILVQKVILNYASKYGIHNQLPTLSIISTDKIGIKHFFFNVTKSHIVILLLKGDGRALHYTDMVKWNSFSFTNKSHITSRRRDNILANH